MTEAELAEYLDLEEPRILTDNHVPVGNLMAPIAEEAFSAGLETSDVLANLPPALVPIGAGGLLVVVVGAGWLTLRRRRRTPTQAVSCL